MKNIFGYLILFFASIIANGCSKWLEATSSSQISADKLFSSRNGFHEALSGLYIDMASPDLYAKNITYYATELTWGGYVPSSTSAISDWQGRRYNTVNAKSTIKSIWTKFYNVIANANKILEELEARRNIIRDDTEYRIMRGELLAIRAYMHFDLIRLFGEYDWEGNANKYTIPYVEVYSKNETPQKNYVNTVALIEKDILEAIELLKIDPITGNAPKNFNENVNIDGYWNNRTKHLNYYAAEALSAKFYLWKNDFAKAKEYAENVIDAAIGKSVIKWLDAEAMVKAVSNDRRDWTFSTEHLFSLEITGLYSICSELLYELNAYSGTVRLLDTFVNTLYPIETYEFFKDSFHEDVRGPAMLLKYSTSGYLNYKFYGSSGQVKEYRNRMPMIRISEMYFILAEAAFIKGDFEETIRCINEIRSHRGITNSITLKYTVSDSEGIHTKTLDATDIWEIFMSEYLREFITEGPCFYFIKRVHNKSYMENINKFNRKIIHSDFMNFANNYSKFPYPAEEFTYGRIQDN